MKRSSTDYVKGTNKVIVVDVCQDSTPFSTGTERREASIWSISSGERLVGPLEHVNSVTGVIFSPNGEHIATACFAGSVRVFNSRTGRELTMSQLPHPQCWS